MKPCRPRTRATQAMIAAEAGVSVPTVSAVLNGRTSGIYFSTATRDRVLAVARQMGYRAHAAARQLRLGRSQVIGLVVDDLTLPFLGAVVHTIVSELRAADYGCLLLELSRPKSPAAALDLCRHAYTAGKVDAILLAGATRELGDEELRLLAAESIPLVLVERRLQDDSIPSVAVDNRDGGRQAMAHLLGQGRRRPVVISGPADNLMAAERLAGAVDAAQTEGVNLSPACVAAGDWSLPSGYQAMQRLLAQQPDAVFAANDLMALGALAALADAGRRVPAEVAVVGYDDIPLARFSRPALSSVRQDPARIGAAAVQLLLAALAQQPFAEDEVPLQPELVVRQSSGTLPTTQTSADNTKVMT